MANTIFVVWPKAVLEKHGVVFPLSYGELINTEGLNLSPSQISAFEAGPQMQGQVPGVLRIIDVVRGQKEPGEGEKWGREDPSETSLRETSSGDLGMPVENIPTKKQAPSQEQTPSRRVPKRRPIPW